MKTTSDVNLFLLPKVELLWSWPGQSSLQRHAVGDNFEVGLLRGRVKVIGKESS